MPLTKRTIIFIVFVVILLVPISVFGTQFMISYVFGTNFTLSEICVVNDDNGFPSLSVAFSCSGTVTVKMIGPDNRLIDSDYLFKGDHDILLRLSEYRHTVVPGAYKLKVYNNDDKEIYSQTFSFKGLNLSILSCEQKWWKRDKLIGGYSLFGLKIYVQNNGDTPAYPYDLRVTMDSDTLIGLALPCTIMPNENEYVECFIYRKSAPSNTTFSINVRDVGGDILTTKSFLTDVEDNVPVKQFSLEYGTSSRKLNIPKSEYLYNYYTNLDRIFDEDYGLYVFDPYDDQYIDVITDYMMLGLSSLSNVEKVNYVASLAQILEYKKDSETNASYEYPNYPIETLFNDNIGRDCEDKAILTVSILRNLGYDTSLLRFPNHMAVGVNLSSTLLPRYDYYVDNYFFLETTTEGNSVGLVPSAYNQSQQEVMVYTIKPRPLLIHNWENNAITIFTHTERGDFVKVKCVVENLGDAVAKNIKVEAAFFTKSGVKSNYENEIISSLEPGAKTEVILSVDIPKSFTTWFKTQIYLNNEVVDEKESVSSFP